jgi:hypothetical protein
MASLKKQTCFAWPGLEIQPCASPASRLKRPEGSERNFVEDIKAPLHGYSPGSFEQYQGTQGCLEKK